jgi:site-specific DNA-cytosine methylase
LKNHGKDYFRLWDGKPGRTFTAVGGVYFRHPDGHRAVTKDEAKVLMGLPPTYKIPAGYSTVVRACAWGVPVMSLEMIIGHVVEGMQ